jgi:hypothetical protein
MRCSTMSPILVSEDENGKMHFKGIDSMERSNIEIVIK